MNRISHEVINENDPFIRKTFTVSERQEASKRSSKHTYYATRFCAKEAIYKAIHAIHACTLCDIEILSDDDGAPYCTMEEYAIQVSIAHEKAYAIAYAIVESKEIDD